MRAKNMAKTEKPNVFREFVFVHKFVDGRGDAKYRRLCLLRVFVGPMLVVLFFR
jgi:hypothetical protein